MKQNLLLFLLFISLQASAQFLNHKEIEQHHKEEANAAQAIGNKILKSLQNEDYAAVVNHFDKNLLQQYDSNKVRIAWRKQIDKNGKFIEIQDIKLLRKAERNTFLLGLNFENGESNFEISLKPSNKISHFRFSPYREIKDWQLPSYADTSQFYIQKLIIPSQLPLLAELCLPNNIKNPPIIVLVHGSGPNDMDESLGPNKIFKDLAYGLASHGIGVLRYNKVSFDYPIKTLDMANNITVEKEVVNDAVVALNMADSLSGGKAFLLGHSLGGNLAPRIAEKTKLKGVVVLAGNVSPLEDLLLYQLDYLLENDSTTALNELSVNIIKWQVNNLKTGNYDSTTAATTLPLGLAATYWLSLENYKPTDLSKKQNIPYLILNGERDYQVPAEEAEKWKNANQHPQSKTIIYPKLNHLFYAGEGLPLPAEYLIESHFNEKVLTDIAQWIKTID